MAWLDTTYSSNSMQTWHYYENNGIINTEVLYLEYSDDGRLEEVSITSEKSTYLIKFANKGSKEKYYVLKNYKYKRIKKDYCTQQHLKKIASLLVH